jgi:hypothetical protein
MFRLIAKIIYTILLIVETIVSLRLIFTFIQANQSNEIVALVYRISDIFITPFTGIVAESVRIGNFVVDTTALLALIVYMVLAFIMIEIIRAFTPTPVTA